MVKFYLLRIYFNTNAETNPPKSLWVKASNVEQITPLMYKRYGRNFRKYEIIQQINR